MSWSKVYTGGTGGGTANHDFFVYFFDTYLAGKTGWSVSAHPDASAFKRSFTYTVAGANNVVGGTDHVTYYWFNWGSTAGTTNTVLYADTTYTTTPGDLGTATVPGNLQSAMTGEWSIWESGLDNSEFAVYNGRKCWWYWPAVPKAMLWDDGLWDGTGTTYRGRVWLWPGGIQGSQQGNPAYNGGSINGGGEYYLVPDCGFDMDTALASPLGSSFPIVFEGIQWMVTEASTTSVSGLAAESYPMISRGPADTVFKMNHPSADGRQFGAVNTNAAIILQDTTSGKYYLHHESSLASNCVMFECGLVEPVLNA